MPAREEKLELESWQKRKFSDCLTNKVENNVDIVCERKVIDTNMPDTAIHHAMHYICQFRQRHFSIQTFTFWTITVFNSDKYIFQFGQIHISIYCM